MRAPTSPLLCQSSSSHLLISQPDNQSQLCHPITTSLLSFISLSIPSASQSHQPWSPPWSLHGGIYLAAAQGRRPSITNLPMESKHQRLCHDFIIKYYLLHLIVYSLYETIILLHSIWSFVIELKCEAFMCPIILTRGEPLTNCSKHFINCSSLMHMFFINYQKCQEI